MLLMDAPLREAVIVTTVFAATGVVVAVKVAVVAFAAKVAVDGTTTTVEPELKATESPAGAGDFRVIVPIELTPPATVEGLKVSELNFGAVTVKDALTVAPLSVALIDTAPSTATGEVLIVNVLSRALGGTTTVAGTVAYG